MASVGDKGVRRAGVASEHLPLWEKSTQQRLVASLFAKAAASPAICLSVPAMATVHCAWHLDHYYLFRMLIVSAIGVRTRIHHQKMPRR